MNKNDYLFTACSFPVCNLFLRLAKLLFEVPLASLPFMYSPFYSYRSPRIANTSTDKTAISPSFNFLPSSLVPAKEFDRFDQYGHIHVSKSIFLHVNQVHLRQSHVQIFSYAKWLSNRFGLPNSHFFNEVRMTFRKFCIDFCSRSCFHSNWIEYIKSVNPFCKSSGVKGVFVPPIGTTTSSEKEPSVMISDSKMIFSG